MTTTFAGARATGRHLDRALDRVVERHVDLRAIALMRMLIGAVVIRHLWPDVRATVTAVERFHVAWWSWLPLPSAELYRALAWLGIVAGAAMVLGLVTRIATATAFGVIGYLLFVDMTGFAHNRAFLVWLLFGLAWLPSGGAWSIAGPIRRVTGNGAVGTTGPWWPILLLRIVVSSVYLTSGGTKLLDPDWRSGRVLWDRMNRNSHLIPFDGVVHDLVTSRTFHHLLSPSAILVELFVGVGLWFGRTRLTAIWIAFAFHLSIELAASVQTFSYSAIAALLLWVTPEARRRTLTAGPRVRFVVRRLDWLGRFTVLPTGDGGGRGSPTLAEPDGTRRRGTDATLTALSRLPLLFPLVAPVLAVDRVRRLRDSSKR